MTAADRRILNNFLFGLFGIKIGDPVWLIEPTECNRCGCPYNGDRGLNWRCNVDGKEQCHPFVYSKPFNYNMLGINFYTTREEAEAALKRKGENV